MTRTGTVLEQEQRGRIRHLRLNRPPRRNALDGELVVALERAIAVAELDAETDVLVLSGAGASFCAGADLEYLLACADGGSSPLGFLASVSALCTHLERSPLPVVAAIHGHAVAGGLELALAADVVVAAESTLIGDGHLRNGLLPAAGSSVRLPRKLGAGKARWLLLSGELLPAATLAADGWPHSVVPDERLLERADELAGSLATSAGVAQSRLKRLLAETEGLGTDEALCRELEAFRENWDAEEIGTRLREFLAGRRSS